MSCSTGSSPTSGRPWLPTVTYLAPVMAVTVGLLFLHEPFHLRLVAGGVLIIGGIVLLNGQGARSRERAEAVPH